MFGAVRGGKPRYAPSSTSSAPSSSRFVDIVVTLYKCQRKVATSRSQGHWEWRVECNGIPLHLTMQIDKSMMVSPNALIVCNGSTVFPKGPGGETSLRRPGKLSEDFHQIWPMRGNVRVMGVERAVELSHFEDGSEDWLAGTLMRHNPNGTFDVLVEHRAKGGIVREEFMSSVSSSLLRDAITKHPIDISERNISLCVPKGNPVEGAYLSIDGFKTIMNFLGRRTPPPMYDGDLPNVTIQVTRDRKTVTANVGRTTLFNHTCGQVRAVSNKCVMVGYGSNSWIIQIGHVQHTIDVWRKSKEHTDITLGVDREILVEACPEEIKCRRDVWECNFRFFGERVINFQLFETDANGHVLESTCVVPQKYAFMHMCKVSVQDLADLSTAVLYVDGLEYRHLPLIEPVGSEHEFSFSLSALEAQYKIVVPHIVNQFATTRRHSKGGEERGRTFNKPGNAPGLVEQLVMCACSCHPQDVSGDSQNTLDVGRSADAFFTTLSREGSGILAPLSGRHMLPDIHMGSREGSLQPQDREVNSAYTPISARTIFDRPSSRGHRNNVAADGISRYSSEPSGFCTLLDAHFTAFSPVVNKDAVLVTPRKPQRSASHPQRSCDTGASEHAYHTRSRSQDFISSQRSHALSPVQENHPAHSSWYDIQDVLPVPSPTVSNYLSSRRGDDI